MTSVAQFIAILSLAATAGVVHPVRPPSSSTIQSTSSAGRIVVLGDSLAVSPSRTDNFVAHLQQRLTSGGLAWTITNAGVRGDTTAGGLRRFERSVPAGTDILILELGANDGLRGMNVAAMEQNLAQMIERAQARGIRVLLCGMEMPPTKGREYMFGFHQVYPRLASRYRVSLVPFLLQGVALDPAMNGPDRVHPNAAGARRIADTVWPHLQGILAPSK